MTGEGEGSKATLIAWLKRRAAQQYGQRVVGQQVWVCWCADATFYKGLITHYSPDTGKHKVSVLCGACACVCAECGTDHEAGDERGFSICMAYGGLMLHFPCPEHSLLAPSSSKEARECMIAMQP